MLMKHCRSEICIKSQSTFVCTYALVSGAFPGFKRGNLGLRGCFSKKGGRCWHFAWMCLWEQATFVSAAFIFVICKHCLNKNLFSYSHKWPEPLSGGWYQLQLSSKGWTQLTEWVVLALQCCSSLFLQQEGRDAGNALVRSSRWRTEGCYPL